MPLVDDEVTLDERYPLGELTQFRSEPSKEEEPSLIGAAFRQENLVASAIDAVHPQFKSDPGHDPISVIKDTVYEDEFLDNFVGSRSEEETRFIMGRIDRELKDRERLAASGIWGIAAGVVAGALDPTILLPVGAPVKIYRGAKAGVSVGKTAAKVGALTGAAVAAQEVGLQYTQEIRPAEETAVSIATGTVLGGILGGAVGLLSKRQLAKLTKELDDVRAGLGRGETPIDPASVGTIMAGADVGAARVLPTGTGELVGGEAIKRTGMAKLSPVTRLQTGEFEQARQTVRHLSDAGLMLAENRQGIATSPGGTVETRIKMWSGGLGNAIETMDDAYSRYWFGASKVAGRIRARTGSEVSRITGRTRGRLTSTEFRREIGKAMARGDEHIIPEVAEAARAMRSNVFDPLKKAAVRAGLLPEDVDAVGAMSYITRVYNRERIVAQRDRFTDILFRHFRNQSDVANMSDAEVREIVTDVIDNILGNSPFRLPGLDIVQGPRGPLRERVLNIRDDQIEEFLERDIETVARFYTRSMAPDVELTQKFGDVQMTDAFGKLRDEFDSLSSRAASDAERTRLQKSYDRAVEDLSAIRDRARNMYGLPDDVSALPYRAAKIGQNINYIRLLGGMTLSAIPDIGRPVMVYGMLRTLRKGWLPLLTSFKTTRLAAAEVKKAGTALDMVLDTRARSIADLFDDWQRGTKFERGVEALSSRFGLVSLMAPWNAVMKQMVGTIAMDGFLRAAKAVDAGTATAKQIRILAEAGIDDAMARRIWSQFNSGGGLIQRGLYLSNTEDWTDRAAIESFRAAIVRDADRVIVTPGLEPPLFMSKPLGKMLGQFKSFAFASTQRTLLAGLQQKDAAFINGLILSIALGGLGTWTRAQTSGFDTKKWSDAKWTTEAVDRSGVLTIFSEVNNIVEKITRGRIGLSAFTGEMASRYQSRNAVGALTGPSFGLASEAIGIMGSAFAGDWAASDTHAVRKLLPYQNVFYLRLLLDRIERSANKLFGIPEKRRN